MIEACTWIGGPDGMGYRFVKDLRPGEAISPDHVEAFGGAPEPAAGAVLPQWLNVELQRRGFKR